MILDLQTLIGEQCLSYFLYPIYIEFGLNEMANRLVVHGTLYKY